MHVVTRRQGEFHIWVGSPSPVDVEVPGLGLSADKEIRVEDPLRIMLADPGSDFEENEVVGTQALRLIGSAGNYPQAQANGGWSFASLQIQELTFNIGHCEGSDR